MSLTTEAEKFFGKKYIDVINQNYFKIFIPATEQKKAEKDFNKAIEEFSLNEMPLSLENVIKIKTKVITAGGNKQLIEWAVNILFSKLKTPTAIIIKTFNNKIK